MPKKMFTLHALATMALVAACGPKAVPTIVPTLPGDGDQNVAKDPVPVNPVALDPAPAPDAWAGRKDLLTPPAALPASKLQLPATQEFKLNNGLTVIVVASAKLPVVSMQLAIKAGRMQEPLSRLGLADLTADMLIRGGTTKHDSLSLAKAIDFVGGSMSANAGYEASILSCTVMAKNLRTCMELLPEVAMKPAFASTEMAPVWQAKIAEIRRRLDDASLLAAAHVQNLLWGSDHVRGWIPSEPQITATTRDDLIVWHKTWFVPNNAVLVVSGDVKAATMKADLEKAFGSWKKSPVPPTPKYATPSLSGIRVRLVDKPGQTQTQIRIGQMGIAHDDPQFFDSMVWNYILGSGDFSSRLMNVVRVKGGKTYGANSAFDRNLDRGSFVASTFTRNAEAMATAKLVIDEIAKMAKEGPSADEVAKATANIAGSYSVRFQSAADVGNAILNAELHGFSPEYVSGYGPRIAAVTAASAAQAASKVLDPRNYVVVMVGDAKDLEPQLKAAGWRYEKVAYTDPIGPEVIEAPMQIDPKAAAAGKAVLDSALAAKGGEAKLRAIKTMKMSASGTTLVQGQTAKLDVARIMVLPDKMRIDATLDLGQKVEISIGIDGNKGWNKDPSGLTDIQTDALAAVAFERWRDPEFILLRHLEKGTAVAPLSDDKINGRGHAVLRMTSPMGVNVTIFVDRETKLISRIAFEEGGAVSVDDFSDYRLVNGIMVAHSRVSIAPGRTTTLKLTKIEFDQAVDPAVFAKPAK
jgi:zinc protease